MGTRAKTDAAKAQKKVSAKNETKKLSYAQPLIKSETIKEARTKKEFEMWVPKPGLSLLFVKDRPEERDLDRFLDHLLDSMLNLDEVDLLKVLTQATGVRVVNSVRLYQDYPRRLVSSASSLVDAEGALVCHSDNTEEVEIVVRADPVNPGMVHLEILPDKNEVDAKTRRVKAGESFIAGSKSFLVMDNEGAAFFRASLAVLGLWSDYHDIASTFLHRAPSGGLAEVAIMHGRSVQVGRTSFYTSNDKQSIQLADESVSRQHAIIRSLPKGVVAVEDCGSTNGTWLGTCRISTVESFRPPQSIFFGTQPTLVAKRSVGNRLAACTKAIRQWIDNKESRILAVLGVADQLPIVHTHKNCHVEIVSLGAGWFYSIAVARTAQRLREVTEKNLGCKSASEWALWAADAFVNIETSEEEYDRDRTVKRTSDSSTENKWNPESIHIAFSQTTTLDLSPHKISSFSMSCLPWPMDGAERLRIQPHLFRVASGITDLNKWSSALVEPFVGLVERFDRGGSSATSLSRNALIIVEELISVFSLIAFAWLQRTATDLCSPLENVKELLRTGSFGCRLAALVRMCQLFDKNARPAFLRSIADDAKFRETLNLLVAIRNDMVHGRAEGDDELVLNLARVICTLVNEYHESLIALRGWAAWDRQSFSGDKPLIVWDGNSRGSTTSLFFWRICRKCECRTKRAGRYGRAIKNGWEEQFPECGHRQMATVEDDPLEVTWLEAPVTNTCSQCGTAYPESELWCPICEVGL